MASGTARTRLSRDETQGQTRERLLESARREVARRGAAASVRDIAEAAGYSQGALYANFGSKEGVLLELMRRHMREEVDGLAAILDVADGSGEGALTRLERWAGTLNQDADWSMLAIELQLHANRSKTFSAEYDAVYDAHRQALGSLVQRLFATLGLKPPGDPVELATGFMALAHGLALGRAQGEPDAVGRTVMLFLRALVGTAKRDVQSPGNA